MPDPTPGGLPDVTLLARMANAMFREAFESADGAEAFPAGLGTALGGFGAALPSHPLPHPSLGFDPGSLGAPLAASPADLPRGSGPVNAAGPSSAGPTLGGVGIAFPSTPLLDPTAPGIAQPSQIPRGGDPSTSSAGLVVPSTTFPGPGAPGIDHSPGLGAPGLGALGIDRLGDPATSPFGSIPSSPPLAGFGSTFPATTPPAAGLPTPGHPAASHPAAGKPAGGYPAASHPAAEHPAGAHPAAFPDVPTLGLDVSAEAELRALLAAAATPVAQPTMPLDLAASAIPFLSGVPTSGAPSATAAAIPRLPATGLDIPGEAELLALLVGARESAAQPTVPTDATLDYYFLPQASEPTASPSGFDVNLVRRDFPILAERVNGRPLIWLDNAATTQKPQAVIDRLSYFYEHENSNVHRAAHELAARATDAYEKARETVKRFINASSTNEIVFVRGTTEAINLISNTWGRRFLGKGDEIVITWLEHHANIVPWQMLCEQTGAILKVAPVDDSGQVKLDEYGKLLGRRTKLVSFTAVSNALGTVTPAKVMTEMAHAAGARVLYDAAQSVSHMRSDVQALDVDWFVFSGHKVFGPTGIGVVYGKPQVLDESPPWQGGGNMIVDVTFEHTEYQPPPGRFEAGTGNIADAVGLGAALEYVERLGIETIGRYEHDLLAYATHLLRDIRGLRLIGTARDKAGVISFVLDGIDTATVGRELNEEGIAVRAGHHCAQPILRRFGVETSVRPSLAFYNTFAEMDRLAAAVLRIQAKHAPYRL